ncbi:manganese efflux pump [Desertifilum sp. FACHB-1129]|uniref:Putative manganese efflux pump MntP n=1 Tax=Desertifilum tharense IPPAS B-1220 TaxID=1781255 RepID=A0A1E5QRA1_9CYAN|nr:manganese efflux pump [Desertifilum sp. FACHB-1129]MBD2321272.1 manganese efflux pump [Desertifilum sp. FACHB-866]MBD2331421.1 manganese efflux pump [Desertifilum sp. FACHB-868]MDA0208667.1 manganese efflux pump MntP family protein [Cyanobacteria bacterium FC1]OEJ77210.1 hypothetical protein BH720_00605 [Desertifilum tharense IPPAS B-1220]
MNVMTTVFMGLGLAADAFAVAISSGITIRHITLNKALKIALFFGGFQAFMPLLGWLAGLSIQDLISSVDHWIAFGLLCLIGGKMVYEACQHEEDCDLKMNPLDTQVLLTLSVATSLDAFAVGLGLGILEDSIFKAAATIGGITFLLCFMGVFIGHKCGCIFQTKIEILGGLILIGIGCKILLEHLF